MKKSELVSEVCRRFRMARVPYSRTIVAAALDFALQIITETVNEGEPVSLHGFGRFDIVVRRAKKGYDFKAGKTIELPPRRKVVFKPSRRFTIK